MSPGEEHVLFLHQLGMAFTQWSNVENALRNCVIACFAEGERNALSVGFFSIENFRSKLEFADKTIVRKLVTRPAKQTLLAEWAGLVERARAASRLRNQLAHRSTQLYPESKPGRRMVLQPWVYRKPKRKTKVPRPPDGSLGLLDIVKYRLEFYALAVSLMNFCHRVLDVKEMFPASSERAMRLPTIQTLVRTIHDELGH